jgi:hypothetical protein
MPTTHSLLDATADLPARIRSGDLSRDEREALAALVHAVRHGRMLTERAEPDSYDLWVAAAWRSVSGVFDTLAALAAEDGAR